MDSRRLPIMSMSRPSDLESTAAMPHTHADFFAQRELRAPGGLTDFLATLKSAPIARLIYMSGVSPTASNSLAAGVALLADAFEAPPPNLLPLALVDDASIACVDCSALDDPDGESGRAVVRWHLKAIDPDFNGALVDSDPIEYIKSLVDEFDGREAGIRSVLKVAKSYKKKFAERRPAGYDLRPIQLACQNVVIGLATLQHDAMFNALRVPDYETCEVSHLATHEGNRALAALLLCDAFQNGGTMELRFGTRETPKPVPPALRRFGRSRGIALGVEDEHAVTPSEARELFLAVTPMPDDLLGRCADILDRGAISPERLCYTLMSADIWKAIELDYILATSSRAASILSGGCAPAMRGDRLAEIEACRAASMVGMLYRRLLKMAADSSGPGEVRIFEDDATRVSWTIREDVGAAAFVGVPAGPLPWQDRSRRGPGFAENGFLIAVPRGLPTPADVQLVGQLQDEHPEAVVVLVVPADMTDVVSPDCFTLSCPERLAELDEGIERRLARLRVTRA
jgi:hypothetical protein